MNPCDATMPDIGFFCTKPEHNDPLHVAAGLEPIICAAWIDGISGVWLHGDELEYVSYMEVPA